jgi:hypothetical protein
VYSLRYKDANPSTYETGFIRRTVKILAKTATAGLVEYQFSVRDSMYSRVRTGFIDESQLPDTIVVNAFPLQDSANTVNDTGSVELNMYSTGPFGHSYPDTGVKVVEYGGRQIPGVLLSLNETGYGVMKYSHQLLKDVGIARFTYYAQDRGWVTGEEAVLLSFNGETFAEPEYSSPLSVRRIVAASPLAGGARLGAEAGYRVDGRTMGPVRAWGFALIMAGSENTRISASRRQLAGTAR